MASRQEQNKYVVYKFYEPDGTWIANSNTDHLLVQSEPSFTSTLNGGQGALTLDLLRRFTDTTPDRAPLQTVGRVDVIIADKDTPAQGTLLWSGNNMEETSEFTSESEVSQSIKFGAVNVNMNNIILKDNNDNTRFTFIDKDPGEILRNLIDFYRAQGGEANYTSSSIDDVGIEITFRVEVESLLEAVERLMENTPFTWYWRVDQNDIFYFKQTDFSQIDHKLIQGNEITDSSFTQRQASVKNDILFVGGKDVNGDVIYRQYKRQTSINAFGRKSKVLEDGRVTTNASADLIANRFLENHVIPERRVEVTVVDDNLMSTTAKRGYDIESLKVGDVVEFDNPEVNSIISTWSFTIPNGTIILGTGLISRSGSSLSGLSTQFVSELTVGGGIFRENLIGDKMFDNGFNSTSVNDVAVDGDNNVYESRDDGDVVKRDQNGNELFSKSIFTSTSKGIDAGEFIYVSGVDSDDKLKKLDRDGNVIWSFTSIPSGYRVVAHAEQHCVVYAAGGAGLDKFSTITGERIWDKGIVGVIAGMDTDDNGDVYLATDDAKKVKKVGFDEQDVWDTQISETNLSNFGLSVSKTKVYVTNDEGFVVQLNKSDGAKQWATDVSTVETQGVHAGVNAIYTVDGEGEVYILDSSGSQTGTFSTIDAGDPTLKDYTLTGNDWDVLSIGYPNGGSFVLANYFTQDRADFEVKSITDDTTATIEAINGYTKDFSTKAFGISLLGGTLFWGTTTWNYSPFSQYKVPLQIEEVQYQFTQAVVKASSQIRSINKNIRQIENSIRAEKVSDTPDSPTVV